MSAPASATTMMPLYELAAELQAIEEVLLEADGELTLETEAKLDGLVGAFEDKAENVAKLLRLFEASAAVAESEAERLAALARTRRNSAASLKRYLLQCMQAAGRPKVGTPLFRIWIQRNARPAIRFTGSDVGELPETVSVEHGYHLRIR